MLKMLVLYRRNLSGAVFTLVIFSAIVVAGIRLTDLDLFETYLYAMPILSAVLPPMFGGGTVTQLALSFGASRRLCYWAQQLAALLLVAIGQAVTWLSFRLSSGWMAARPSVDWTWGGIALLFCACELGAQGSILSSTLEKGWRRSLTVTAAWVLDFMLLMIVEVCLILEGEPLFDVLRPVSVRNPIWRLAALGFLAAAVVLGAIARVRFKRLVVKL